MRILVDLYLVIVLSALVLALMFKGFVLLAMILVVTLIIIYLKD
jgi:hypothetical protein